MMMMMMMRGFEWKEAEQDLFERAQKDNGCHNHTLNVSDSLVKSALKAARAGDEGHQFLPVVPPLLCQEKK